jgi:hypothetical protein
LTATDLAFSRISPVLNTTQFLAEMSSTDLARRKPGVQIPSPPPQEDFAAFNLLADLARDLQLEATVEYIPLGGELDLNRDNLIVICGPRLSPVVRQVLESDPVLGFDQDDAGRWLLLDRRTGERHPSPSDLPQPRPADVGYLSRLRSPDGNGSFILLAGIHAVGSHGVIAFLRRELADLYEQVDLQPFSTLVATEYDPVTRQLDAPMSRMRR